MSWFSVNYTRVLDGNKTAIATSISKEFKYAHMPTFNIYSSNKKLYVKPVI